MIKRVIAVTLCVLMSLTAVPAYMDSVGYGYSAEAAADYSIPYCYSQLSKKARNVYKQIRQDIFNCKKNTSKKFTIGEKDANIIARLIYDQEPLMFNVKSITTYSYSDDEIVEFEFEYYFNKKTYDKMVKDCEKAADKILAKADKETNKYRKLRIIHDEIVNSADYDKTTKRSGDIYGTLVEKKARCAGYAQAFNYLCSKAGIRTVNIVGEAGSESHMWNKVYYNKKWYNIDVTWDDPSFTDHADDDLSKMLIDLNSYEYFMINDKTISSNHKEYSEKKIYTKYPEAADDSIDYYKVNKKYADTSEEAKKFLKNCIKSAKKNKSAAVKFKCSPEVFKEIQKIINSKDKFSDLIKETIGEQRNGYSYTWVQSCDKDIHCISIAIGFN